MAVGPLAASDAALVVALVVSAVTDLRVGRIFNLVTYPAILVGLGAALAGFGPSVSSAVIGCSVGGLSLYILFAAGWMGGGDVKLMAAVGALKGYPFILHAMFYAIFVGGLSAALMLVWQGHTRAVLADLAAVARRLGAPRGTAAAPIPSRGGSFPFGVAIGIGSMVALVLERLQ